MNHRRIAIIFLVIIILIMAYYNSLKEAIENPDYDASIPDKYKYSELLTEYILLMKETNLALSNSNRDDYWSQFNNLFTYQVPTH
jgi:hypothetical protein